MTVDQINRELDALLEELRPDPKKMARYVELKRLRRSMRGKA